MLVLREETQQTIQSVNGKLNNLSSCMYTSLELQKSEAKQIQGEMSKQLGDYKSEVKSEMCKIQTEFAKIRQDLNLDSLGMLEGKLEAKMDEGFDMKLRKLESQLEKLSGVGSAVCGDYYLSPVDRESSQVHGVDDGHSGLLPTPVPPAVPSSQRNYMSDKSRNEESEPDENKEEREGEEEEDFVEKILKGEENVSFAGGQCETKQLGRSKTEETYAI